MFANLFCITHYKLLLLLYKCFGVLLKFLTAVAGKYTAAWTVNTVQFCFVNFVVIFYFENCRFFAKHWMYFCALYCRPTTT